MMKGRIDNPFEIGQWKELCYRKRVLAYYHGRYAMAHLAVGSPGSDDNFHLIEIFEVCPEFEEWLRKNQRYPLLVEDYTVGLAYREGKKKEPLRDTGYVVISKPRSARKQEDEEPHEI